MSFKSCMRGCGSSGDLSAEGCVVGGKESGICDVVGVLLDELEGKRGTGGRFRVGVGVAGIIGPLGVGVWI